MSIRTCHWDEIKAEGILADVNKELHDALDEASTGLSPPVLFDVRFPFGVDIISNGRPLLFNEPPNKELTFENTIIDGLTLENFPSYFQCRYDHPLSVVLSGEVEVYRTNDYQYGSGSSKKVVYRYPMKMFGPGEIFGLFGTADTVFGVVRESKHFNYSASSGKSCIYPILPDPDTAKKKYQAVARTLCESHRMTFHNSTILDLFIRLFPELAQAVDHPVRILVIPDRWFLGLDSSDNRRLQQLIHSTAWKQSVVHLDRSLTIADLIRKMSVIVGHRSHFYAELVYSLKEAMEGRLPILKPANDSHPWSPPIRKLLDEKMLYYPSYLLHCEPLREKNDWGMFPLVTLPFTSVPDLRSSNATMDVVMDELLPLLKGSYPGVYDGLASLKILRSDKKKSQSNEAARFIKDLMPGAYSVGIYCQTIVKIER